MDKIRKKIDESFSKGLINEVEFLKANIQYDNLLEKASKGEGSRGGKIIGHTKSGKAVYASGRVDGARDKMSSQDHLDAAHLHNNRANEHRTKMFSTAGLSDHVKQQTSSLIEHHFNRAKEHEVAAHSQLQEEHESGLSKDEKKILADQKKKQIEHHDKMMNFHNDLANHIREKYPNEGLNDDIRDAWQHHADKASHHFNELGKLQPEKK